MEEANGCVVRAQKLIWENWPSIFPINFMPLEREHRVFGTMMQEEHKKGYAVDFLAQFNSRKYLIECDVNDSAADIWHGFKILGYRSAYCIDRHVSASSIGMMIFFHDRLFSHRVRNILAVSRIEYATFQTADGFPILKQCSLWRTQ